MHDLFVPYHLHVCEALHPLLRILAWLMWEMVLMRAPWNLCGLIVCPRGAEPSSRWVRAGWYRFRASGLQRVEQRRWSGFLIAESTAELRELWSMKGTWGKYFKEALYRQETTNWSWILSSWLLNSGCNGCFNRFLFCREDWDPRIWIRPQRESNQTYSC